MIHTINNANEDIPMTINDLLAQYNAIAPTSIKAWKGKKADLQAKLEALQSAPKKDKAKSKAKSAKMNGAAINGTLSVVQIAGELSINPKVARARLRRKGLVATNGRWVSVKRDSAEHKAIVATLGG